MTAKVCFHGKLLVAFSVAAAFMYNNTQPNYNFCTVLCSWHWDTIWLPLLKLFLNTAHIYGTVQCLHTDLKSAIKGVTCYSCIGGYQLLHSEPQIRQPILFHGKA